MSSKFNQNEVLDLSMDQNYQNALKAIRILEEGGFEARLAGGCVRDRQLNIRPKDYDVATLAKPDEICAIFKQKNIKTVPTGIDHGTITVVMSGQPIEVTTLRLDVATDGRRAVVRFGTSFEEDSLRRDFTINALFEDKEGKVYDYHQGLEDLKSGTLRFVGDAKTRIREDYLRILRLFRFWARFGFRPAAGTLRAISEEVRGLEKISLERLTSELLLLLEGDSLSEVLQAMQDTGTLQKAFDFPISIELETITDWDAYKLNKKADTAMARLSVLFAKTLDISDQDKVLRRLKLSNHQKELLTTLVRDPLPDEPLDAAKVFEWLDRIETRFSESVAKDILFPVWTKLRSHAKVSEIEKIIATESHRRISPISGQVLIQKLGFKQGALLGEVLDELKRSYRRGEWQTEDEGLERARRALHKG